MSANLHLIHDRDQIGDTPIVRYNRVSHPGDVLVKIYKSVNGNVEKDMSRSGRIPDGCVVTTIDATLRDYVLDAFNVGVKGYMLPSNKDFGSSVPLVWTKRAQDGDVTRDTICMQYVTGSCIATIDHDPHTASKHTYSEPGKLWEQLTLLFPVAFLSAAHASYHSSSSFIHRPDGSSYSGVKGFHIAIAVQDATDLPRFSKALFERLWLAGRGYIAITKSGSMLPRTIFDPKVLEPQQPLFAGGAHCIDGITQHRPAPEVRAGGYVDTTKVLSLDDEERQKYNQMVDIAKASCAPEAKRISLQYQNAAVEKLVTSGVLKERAVRTVSLRMAGTLSGADILEFADLGKVTVADVLADPDRFDRHYLSDPVEPEYGSPMTAMFFANAEKRNPQIYSHAHGGGNYRLRHDEESLSARLASMSKEDVVAGWLTLVESAELLPDAIERVLKTVSQKTGNTVGALKKTLRAAQNSAQMSIQATAPDPTVELADELLSTRFDNGKYLLHTETKHWWRYTGTHWVQIQDAVLSGYLLELVDAKWGRVVVQYAAQGKNSPPPVATIVASTLAVLRSRCVKSGDPMRLQLAKQSAINLLNGTLWLDGDEPVLRPHNPADYLTNCSSINFDPNANAPTFEHALRGMLCDEDGTPFPDQDEMFRHVVELLGYVCQSQRFLKVFYIFYGPGDNGKTKLTKLLRLVLGPDSIAFDRLAGVGEESSRFATSKLVGKLAVVDDDLDHDYALPDGLLKKIAEEKPMTAEEKFKSPMAFICQVVPIFLSNSLPITSDMSRGMRTRAQVVNFPRQFKRPEEVAPGDINVQRPELWTKVYEEELPGVLNFFIEGYYRIKSRNGLLQPPSAIKAFDAWLSNSNVVPRFIDEACEKIEASTFEHTTSELYQAFELYCRDQNVQPKFRLARNRMKQRLESLGYRVAHTNAGSGVYGLRLNDSWRSRFPFWPETMQIADGSSWV